MADYPLHSPDELRQLLRYEPETGKLFWRERPGFSPSEKRFNAMHAGKEALTAKQNGYSVGLIYRRNVSAHRVAWALFHGEWPKGQIDHINGERDDNRICNLRDVDPSTNSRNCKKYVSNTSGVSGVCWNKNAGKWQANIRIGRRVIHLGVFDALELAVAVRKEAEKKYGFHENHGR